MSIKRHWYELSCAIVLSIVLSACGSDNAAPNTMNETASTAPATPGSISAGSVRGSAEESSDVPSGENAELLAAIERRYTQSCAACHISGASGAPRTHDVEAWAPRMEKGEAELLNSIRNGLNAMPPSGMCFDCSDDEYLALTRFMASPKP